MVKILEHIKKSVNDKHQCFRWEKLLSKNVKDNDSIACNYGNNSVVETTENVFANTQMFVLYLQSKFYKIVPFILHKQICLCECKVILHVFNFQQQMVYCSVYNK
jgi:hypothetical protein